MSKCSVQGCNITADFLLSHIDDGNTRKVFCSNHVLMYFLKLEALFYFKSLNRLHNCL